METKNPIILFDGVCNLCNGAVQFVIRNDKKKFFRFAALQSEAGIELSKKYQLPTDSMKTFVLIANNKCYTRSTAALNVGKMLGGILSLGYIFIVVPPFIRDGIYNWIAKNRYRWFGQKESCMIPTPELRDRFL
jgi:predicted DCC family thiol-disulfide oxidoreductase YuxK